MQFSRSRRWSAFICILLTMVYSVSLPAQSGQAVAVTGVVSDSSGAIVPDAVVRVTQLSTEAMHVVRTGGDGSFILLALSAGRYRVSIGAPGFATQQLDIELKGAAFRLPVVLTPEGAHIRNPAFDVTPHRYISGIITEKGIFGPPYSETLKAAFETVVPHS